MQFLKSGGTKEGQAALLDRLQRELTAGKRVLWLVSGGSNIPVSVAVMDALPGEVTGNLTVLLTDERYGPAGHADSNQAQLVQAGFAPKRAAFPPVLTSDLPLEATRRHYDAVAQQAFREADIIIGQFGIGTDGHTAGILPHSAATGSPEFVAAYEAADYKRLTLTFHALKRVSVAYAFVFGAAKRGALQKLQAGLVPFAEEPAQILKEIPEAYVYNDQVEAHG